MMPQAGQIVDAIIFDFGGVLTITEPIQQELHRYERQLRLPEDTIVLAIGSGPAWEAVSTGAISEAEYWEQVADGFASKLPQTFGRFQHGTLPYAEFEPGCGGAGAPVARTGEDRFVEQRHHQPG